MPEDMTRETDQEGPCWRLARMLFALYEDLRARRTCNAPTIWKTIKACTDRSGVGPDIVTQTMAMIMEANGLSLELVAADLWLEGARRDDGPICVAAEVNNIRTRFTEIEQRVHGFLACAQIEAEAIDAACARIAPTSSDAAPGDVVSLLPRRDAGRR